MQIELLAAACGLSILLGTGWYAYHEHVGADRARAESAARKVTASANDLALKTANDDAPQREIRYVEVVRNVATAGPVSAACADDAAMRAAGAGVVSMRNAYCSDHPDRCTYDRVPGQGHRSP